MLVAFFLHAIELLILTFDFHIHVTGVMRCFQVSIYLFPVSRMDKVDITENFCAVFSYFVS